MVLAGVEGGSSCDAPILYSQPCGITLLFGMSGLSWILFYGNSTKIRTVIGRNKGPNSIETIAAHFTDFRENGSESQIFSDEVSVSYW